MDESKKLLEKLFRNNLFIFFLLFFLVAICYSNSLFNNFVSDDWGIFQVSYTPQAIFPNLSALFTNYPEQIYRAILIYSKLTSSIFFRLPNILAHLGNTFLVILIITKFHKRKTAIMTSLLFAVHPILIESVTWISGGSYAKYSFFFLLSFWLYLKSHPKRKYNIFSIISFYLALVHNEKATPLFLIFPIFEISFGNLKNNWKKCLPYFLISITKVLLLIPATNIYQNVLQTQFYQEKISNNPLIQIPIAITSYLELLLWPDKLTLYHTELSFNQTEYLIRLFIFILYLVLITWSFFKNKYLFFWTPFFLISLLITLNPWGFGWVVAERYVYLGSLGIFAVMAYFLTKLSGNKKMQLPVLVTFMILLVLLCLRTITRNLDWQNEDYLWISAARTSPSSSQNHNNLGDYYGRHGNLPKAIEEFQIAILLNPKYADAYHNLANTYQQIGDTNNATKNYQLAIKHNPGLWQSYQNLAILYYRHGEKEKALNLLQNFLKDNPKNNIMQNLHNKMLISN